MTPPHTTIGTCSCTPRSGGPCPFGRRVARRVASLNTPHTCRSPGMPPLLREATDSTPLESIHIRRPAPDQPRPSCLTRSGPTVPPQRARRPTP